MIVFGYRLPLFSSLVVWAILWEILGHTDAKLILPPLSAIALRIVEIAPTESFLKALIITGKAFFAGSLVAILIGIPLGVLMGRSKIADDLLLPWVNVFLSNFCDFHFFSRCIFQFFVFGSRKGCFFINI